MPWRKPAADDPPDWYQRGSEFDAAMASCGFTRHEQDDDPLTRDVGYWTGEMGGLYLNRFLTGKGRTKAWKLAAVTVCYALLRMESEIRGEGVLIVPHSHAGHVAMFGLAMLARHAKGKWTYPVYVLDVDMPIRDTRRKDYDAGLAAVSESGGQWLHCYSGNGLSSWARWSGSRRKVWGIPVPFFGRHKLDGATNTKIEGGHSGILHGDGLRQLPGVLASVFHK